MGVYLEQKEIRFLIAGAHSGGHLFPAVAVARALKRKFSEAKILFITSGGSLESSVVEKEGFKKRRIFVERLKGMKFRRLITGILLLPVAAVQSIAILISFRPAIVIGFGGFTAGPVIFAAFLLRKRAVILEPNSIPGLTNRISGILASTVITNFASCIRYFPAKKVKMLGIPVREEIRAIGAVDLMRNRGNILVFGGSQGARFINEEIPAVLAEVNAKVPLKVVHQSGENDYEFVKETYKKLGVDAVVEKFIFNMAEIYRNSCFAICRAGAATIGELSCVRLPALLIPFPHAADNHQFFNAKELADLGAAFIMEQRDFDRSKAVSTILGFLENMETAAGMAAKMEEFGSSRGDMEKIVNEVLCGDK